MPRLSDIIGKVIRFKDFGKSTRVQVSRSPEPICTDLQTVHDWLIQRNGNKPYFCLMLQEGEDTTAFLLNPDHTPVIFYDKEPALTEAASLKDPRVWVMELG